MNNNMQDILKNYYAAGGKTLFENKILLEYDQATTISKWGDRIIQAAYINSKTLGGDGWMDMDRNSRDFVRNRLGSWMGVVTDGEPESRYPNYAKQRQEFLTDFLTELEKMDPTNNKQYVMWLVKTYCQSIQADARHQADFERESPQADLAGHWSEWDTDLLPSDDEDFDTSGNYYGDDWSVDDPSVLNSFRLEDSEQIANTLSNYHRIKPQLPVPERDINRFKTFSRLDDYVENIMDGKEIAKPETDNQTLKRSDVEVLYNGPLGTVTIPRSFEASCELGRGTKWCTTGKDSHYYDSYSSRGDLIIYNEKPGNNKYQIHVTLDGIEARDARDRLIPPVKKTEFTQKHPVLSKIISAELDKIFAIQAQQPFTSDGITRYGSDPVGQVRDFVKFNAKHKGGVMRYVDEYYTQYALPSILKKSPTAPGREFFNLMLTYAQQRGKPWPEAQKLLLAITVGVANSADLSNNVELKTVNRLTQHTEALGSTPELAQFKTDLLNKIQSQEQ